MRNYLLLFDYITAYLCILNLRKENHETDHHFAFNASTD